MHSFDNLCVFIIVATVSTSLLSFTHSISIPPNELSDEMVGESQIDDYSQDPTNQNLQQQQQEPDEGFDNKPKVLRFEGGGKKKVPEWFKVMIATYSSAPGVFRYFHAPQSPYWKVINLSTHKLGTRHNKYKRYMGVEVADFLNPSKNGGGNSDLGEGGQDPDEERPKKVRLIGSG